MNLYFDVLPGLTLAIMPWFMENVHIVFSLGTSLAGLFVMALSFSKGKIWVMG